MNVLTGRLVSAASISRAALVVVSILLAPLVCVNIADADVNLQLQDSDNRTDGLMAEYLAESKILTDFISLIDENLVLDPPLVLAIGSTEGPEYEMETNTLRFPYGYLGRAIETQAELVEDRDLALARALDIVEYTLYNLLGHALLGKSSADSDVDEDAEAVSSWLMLKHFQNGGEQWHAAINAFGNASQKLDGPLSDYWHAHSLYRLRQNVIECWILGSNPEAFETLLPAVPDADSRRSDCVAKWNVLQEQVLVHLDGQLEKNAPVLRRPIIGVVNQ